MKKGLGFMLKFIFYKRKNVLKKQGFYFSLLSSISRTILSYILFKELTTIGKSDNSAVIERAKELKLAFSCLVKKYSNMIVKKIVLISAFSFIYCSKQRLVNLLFLRGEICADIWFADVVITGLLESENVRVCSFFLYLRFLPL